MKTYNKYIALAALALGFAACSQEEDFAPQSSDIVQIASAHIATEVQTRVNTDGAGDAFEAGDEILLVNTSRDTKNQGTYTYDGTDWSLTGGMVLWASGTGNNTFDAYYPASKEFTLPTNQSTLEGLKSADYMMATATATKGNAVELSFSHQNAKVTITTEMNSQYATDATVSDLTIGGITPYNPENRNTYTAILEPSESGFTVNLTVDGDNLTATSSAALEAGMYYTFTLTVGKATATLGEVSVIPWTDITLTGGEAKDITITSVIENGEAVVTVPDGASPDNFANVITSVIEGGTTKLTVTGITGEGEAQQEFLEKLRTILQRGLSEGTEISLTMPDLTNLSCPFNSTPTLVEFNAPELLTLCDDAFYYCRSLSSVYLPKVTTMGKIAFASTALTSIDLPEATSLGYQAFYGCEALESVHLPKVTTIGEKAFQMAHGIKSLKFGSVITSIGNLAFASTFPENCDLQLAEGQKGFTMDDNYDYTITDTDVALDGTTTEWAGKTWKSINKYVPDAE